MAADLALRLDHLRHKALLLCLQLIRLLDQALHLSFPILCGSHPDIKVPFLDEMPQRVPEFSSL